MESTYLHHHCESQALTGLINSLRENATSETVDPPLQEMAKDLYESGKELWENFQLEKTRSNIGTRSLSENIRRHDGLSGTPHTLLECRELGEVKVVLKSTNGPASGLVSLRSLDWPKMIWRGQEFHAFVHSREDSGSGCLAIIQIANGKAPDRVARIHWIVQTGVRGGVGEGEERRIVLICQLYPSLGNLVRDVWATLGFGFLTRRPIDPTYYHFYQEQVVSALVFTPTTIYRHELMIALTHSKVGCIPPLSEFLVLTNGYEAFEAIPHKRVLSI